jgi:hypothetical protein
VRDLRLTVADNARLLTVAACHENLARLDELIAANGAVNRYVEAREFFARNLERCLRNREEPHHDYRNTAPAGP